MLLKAPANSVKWSNSGSRGDSGGRRFCLEEAGVARQNTSRVATDLMRLAAKTSGKRNLRRYKAVEAQHLLRCYLRDYFVHNAACVGVSGGRTEEIAEPSSSKPVDCGTPPSEPS